MSEPLNLTADTFSAEVEQATGPVLVDFWSQTCPHCLALAPQFEKAAAENSGVRFAKLSLQEGGALFAPHRVSGVPTLILFKDGKEVDRRAGYATSEAIGEWLQGSR